MAGARQLTTYGVGEWDDIDLPGVTLTHADVALCKRLAEQGEPRLSIEEMQGGLRVRATSWVGLVQLGAIQLHVVPKLAGEYLGLVRLLEWLGGLDELTELESDPHIDLAGTHLLDLVALLLVREVERVLRRGARADYVVHEDALPVLRGRLLFDRQLRRRQGRLDRLECRYDERSADIFDNRLLLAAAERCATRTEQIGIRRRATRVRARLAQICDARDVSLPRRPVSYDRLNSYYRQVHDLAWLVLEGTQGLDDLYVSGDTRSFAFLLDMNRIFERFVERILLRAVTPRGVHLSFQRRSGSVVRRADTGSTYSQLIPDILASTDDPPATWPIDAKYKRYSERRVDPSDIAQVFLYATSLGVRQDGGPPHALIVYPAESQELERLPLAVHRVGGKELATVAALGVPIPRVLDEAAGDDAAGSVTRNIADAILEPIASLPAGS
jgi:5-methylcytosine-specific restriction enzyme subunit McrC